MARITYANRLEALAKKPLSDYDKGFVESLTNHYSKKRSLSAGRAAAVRRLEERYSDENLAKAAENPMNERLSALGLRVSKGTWDAGFVESLALQVARGRMLSDNQIKVLKKIEHRHSDKAIASKAKWISEYSGDSRMQEMAKICATYYSAAGYFSALSQNILSNSEFVPSHEQFTKITGNKYAKKILSAWYDSPKFELGEYVSLRATAPGSARRTFKKAGVVVKVNAAYPRTPALGAKIYQILPFGAASTLIIEERYLKSARIK
jgi:hypothetical protein